jgi:hypothetical protein
MRASKQAGRLTGRLVGRQKMTKKDRMKQNRTNGYKEKEEREYT